MTKPLTYERHHDLVVRMGLTSWDGARFPRRGSVMMDSFPGLSHRWYHYHWLGFTASCHDDSYLSSRLPLSLHIYIYRGPFYIPPSVVYERLRWVMMLPVYFPYLLTFSS
jgi:hypothetical protein